MDIVVVGERSAPVPLTPFIAGRGVLVVMSWREGSAVLGVSGESSLALTSVGGNSPMQGEPLLWWTSPEDPMLTLFTLDAATESMERESLDVGVLSMLEALDHARGALANVVIPAGRVLA